MTQVLKNGNWKIGHASIVRIIKKFQDFFFSANTTPS